VTPGRGSADIKAKREYVDYLRDILDAIEKAEQFSTGMDFAAEIICCPGNYPRFDGVTPVNSRTGKQNLVRGNMKKDIERVVRSIISHFGVEKIVLFGSHARGAAIYVIK
jgi:hypothetical protein